MVVDRALLVATGLHRGRAKGSRVEDETHLRTYLNGQDFSSSSVQKRMDIVDDHISSLREAGSAVL